MPTTNWAAKALRVLLSDSPRTTRKPRQSWWLSLNFQGCMSGSALGARSHFPIVAATPATKTADGSMEEMIEMVEAVAGGFREAVRVPLLLGHGWQESEFRFNDYYGPFRSSRSRVSRSRALDMTGGKLNVTLEWKPWPLRNATAAPSSCC